MGAAEDQLGQYDHSSGYYDSNGIWHPSLTNSQKKENTPIKFSPLEGWAAKQFGGEMLGSEGAKEATTQLAANAAENEAWNAAATQATTPTIAGNFGSMGFGPQAGVVAGTAMTAKGLYDLVKGKKSDTPTRVVTAMSTFGGSELARALGMGGKSTKDYQRERQDKVINAGNKGWADYYSQNRDAPEGATPENVQRGTAGDLKGRWVKPDGTWDAREYAGVQGNADTFGDKWFTLNEAQRNEVVTRLKNEGLYHNDKGDVLISDGNKGRASEIFNEVVGSPSSSGLTKEQLAAMGA